MLGHFFGKIGKIPPVNRLRRVQVQISIFAQKGQIRTKKGPKSAGPGRFLTVNIWIHFKSNNLVKDSR